MSTTTPQTSGMSQLDTLVSSEEEEAYRSSLGISARAPSRGLTGKDSILTALTHNGKQLQEAFPRGGVRSGRILNAPILVGAPEGYFDKYHGIVKKVTTSTQAHLSKLKDITPISIAKENPTDDDLQEGAYSLIVENVRKAFDEIPDVIQYDAIERALITQMVFSEIVGMSLLDPLWRDRGITEIFVNGPNDIQFEYKGVVRVIRSIHFRDRRHLQDLIDRLYGAIGRTVSPTNPLRPGRLPDLSRMTAIHHSIAPDGPNLTIRRHPKEYWTPQDLLNLNSANKEMLTDLGNWINRGVSFIVSGATSTGKTSFLNALTGFYPDDQRLLLLEDNLEMKPNPKKLWAAAMECNQDITEDGRKVGVSMRDLVQISLRMAPKIIVIGEIRDGAMYDLIQALNTGHNGASTVHTDSPSEAMNRIQSLAMQSGVVKEETVSTMIPAAFDIVVQLEKFPDGTRRVSEIAEILPERIANAEGKLQLKTSPLWRFEATGTDASGKILGDWIKVEEMSETRRKKHRLDIQTPLSWDQLREISSVDGITITQAGYL